MEFCKYHKFSNKNFLLLIFAKAKNKNIKKFLGTKSILCTLQTPLGLDPVLA